jgi:AcrR family transcriptional regulator
MTKVDLKKSKKRQDILDSAYELFTTKGFSNTTILNIALGAGVGKGTFYLYFDSKEAVRSELIIRKASSILTTAVDEEEKHLGGLRGVGLADRFIYVADYILNYLSQDLVLLKFISKNLSWGLFLNSTIECDSADSISFKEFIQRLIEKEHTPLRDPDLLIYTLIELVNSTCYTVILHSDPFSFEEYKPYLYHSIRLLIEDAIEK